MKLEIKGNTVVAWAKGSKHQFYEDRYRILSKEVKIVDRQNRGELFGIFDGIGSAPKGREAAQEMATKLEDFYYQTQKYPATWEGVHQLLLNTNQSIYDWGFISETQIPLGGCAGTVVWIFNQDLHFFHAGDTVAILIRAGKAQQITRIHENQEGAIVEYFGFGPPLDIDLHHLVWEDMDKLVFLTDGVTKVYHPMEVATFLEGYEDTRQGASALTRSAIAKGSSDDITIMIIELDET